MRLQCSVCKAPYLRDVAKEEYSRNGGKFYCAQCKRITPHKERK